LFGSFSVAVDMLAATFFPLSASFSATIAQNLSRRPIPIDTSRIGEFLASLDVNKKSKWKFKCAIESR
jgi:hypothetical protein